MTNPNREWLRRRNRRSNIKHGERWFGPVRVHGRWGGIRHHIWLMQGAISYNRLPPASRKAWTVSAIACAYNNPGFFVPIRLRWYSADAGAIVQLQVRVPWIGSTRGHVPL